jgi:predicted unusual protein kinase regulating ubiquinone biosynthesis (AarF/ABC1/UbiB family)
MAHLGREARLQLMSLLLGLAGGDGEAVADACLDIGIPGPAVAPGRFRSEIALMVARLSGRALGELALGRVLLDVARVAVLSDLRIPPEMMLLGKTLLHLEGVCRRLDPAMDPVATMREMAAPLLGRQLLGELSQQRALAATLELRSLLREGPASLRRLLRRAAGNDLRVGLRIEGAEGLQEAVQKVASRITLGLITAALIVGSALLVNVAAGRTLWGYPVFALVGFLLAFGLGLYLVGKIILADRY